jgi:hypothetical protein
MEDNNGWQTESRIDEKKRDRIKGILKFKVKFIISHPLKIKLNKI